MDEISTKQKNSSFLPFLADFQCFYRFSGEIFFFFARKLRRGFLSNAFEIYRDCSLVKRPEPLPQAKRLDNF